MNNEDPDTYPAPELALQVQPRVLDDCAFNQTDIQAANQTPVGRTAKAPEAHLRTAVGLIPTPCDTPTSTTSESELPIVGEPVRRQGAGSLRRQRSP